MTSFAHLTLILLLHYLVKCRSRSLAALAHASAQKIILRPQNHWKNDHLYVPTATKKRNINATHLLKIRSKFSKSVMVSIAVSSLGASNIHVFEPGVKIKVNDIIATLFWDMLLPDISAVSGSEFLVFQQDSAPSHRAKVTVALLDQETPDFIPAALCRLTHWTSTRLTTLCAVCFRNKSIVRKSRTSTNWNNASTVSGPLWVTRLLNVLLASGISVYALAFVLEADILSTCCNKDDVMWQVWLFERITESRVCRYSVNHLNVHLIIALKAQSVTSNSPR